MNMREIISLVEQKQLPILPIQNEVPYWIKPLVPMTKRLGLKNWNQGGCFAFAEVLQKVFKGELWGICSHQKFEDDEDYPVEHALTKINNHFYDYTGLVDTDAMLKYYEKKSKKTMFLLPKSNPLVFWFEDEFLDDNDFKQLKTILVGKFS